jgi:hypothetical protein
MTLGDLILSGVINSENRLKIAIQKAYGLDIKTGYWFNDYILEFRDWEIKEFSWNKGNGWSILVGEETENEGNEGNEG